MKILVPIDDDASRVRAQAAAVTSIPGAADAVEVTVLHVFDGRRRAETTSVRQLATGRLVYDGLTGAGIRVDTLARAGDPGPEIVRAADELDADLIVLGGRKRSILGTILFGSVSEAVTRATDRPVAITGGLSPADDDDRTRPVASGEASTP